MPPEPPELKELYQRRDAAIIGVIDDLKQALGPNAAADLEDYVKNKFGRTSRVEHGSLPPALQQKLQEYGEQRSREMQEQKRREREAQQQQQRPEKQEVQP
jgi:hypothetical protein